MMQGLPESMKLPLYGNTNIAGGYHSSSLLGFQFHAKLEIVRQPKKRGYRFRYQSEGKTHGMLPGEPNENDNKDGKIYPCIKLTGHHGRAKVVMTLVTDKEPYPIHPHTLLIDKLPVAGYHIIDIEGMNHKELKNVAIQHANKLNLEDKIIDRELQTRFVQEMAIQSYMHQREAGIEFERYIDCLQDKEPDVDFYDHKTKIRLPASDVEILRREAKKRQKAINMSSCRLCFVAFLQDPATGKYSKALAPVYSDEIIDGKKKEGAPLKIIRMSHVAGSVEGGKEIWLLSDKVDAEDTEVYFWEKKPMKDEVYWEGYGEFNKTDVYKQALIVFKTPAYVDQNIDQPRTVNLQLRRKRDKNCVSDIHNFSYKPKHYDRYGLREKRRKVLPPELYNPPPAKRQAVEFSGSSNDPLSSSRWNPPIPPFTALGGGNTVGGPSENPTLSDLFFRGDSIPNGDGGSGGGLSLQPNLALNSSTWSAGPLGQFLSSYKAANNPNGGETSDSDSKDES